MGFKIGCELEGCYNGLYFPLLENKLNKYFECVGDVSLHYSNIFNSEYCRELITKVKKDKKGFFNALKHLKKLSGTELNSFVDFNSTSGCHIHFSFNNISFKNIDTKWLYPLRRRFFKKLALSNIKSKDEIKKQYFRNMAKEVNKNKNWYRDKFSEFNLLSERNGNGFEWRSINLMGVKSWEEFFELFEIVYSCLVWYEKYLNKKYSPFFIVEIEPGEETQQLIFNKLEQEGEVIEDEININSEGF